MQGQKRDDTSAAQERQHDYPSSAAEQRPRPYIWKEGLILIAAIDADDAPWQIPKHFERWFL